MCPFGVYTGLFRCMLLLLLVPTERAGHQVSELVKHFQNICSRISPPLPDINRFDLSMVCQTLSSIQRATSRQSRCGQSVCLNSLVCIADKHPTISADKTRQVKGTGGEDRHRATNVGHTPQPQTQKSARPKRKNIKACRPRQACT